MGQPEKRFKCGRCEVSIFENTRTTKDGRELSTKKASFQVRYRDADGEWKSTKSLDINDIPKARLVLEEAYRYLVLKREDNDQ